MNVSQFTSTKKGVLSDIAEIIMGQSPNGESYNKDGNGVPLINGPTEFGPISPKIIQWTDKPTKYAHDKDLLLCVRGSSIGRMNISNDTYCIGRGVAAIRPINKNINADYLRFLVQRNVHKILKKSAGSTFPNLSSSDLKSFPISIPNIEIQQLIGNFLSNISKKIQLQQQKIDLLQEQKKGFLQKMFPKAGETQPEMRFEGFTGGWEQCKLEEVANIFDGTHQTPKYTSTGVKFVSVENIATLETNKFISQEAYDKEYSKKQAKKGDVLMTRIGDIGTAKVIETEESLAYYVTLALLKPNKVDSDFLAWLISSPEVQRNIWKRTLHIAFPKKINLGEINKSEIMVPSNKEQTKIGAFFKKIDDTIALHQQKLDLYKEQKKGLMQQMFI